jgi:hypothetical protein
MILKVAGVCPDEAHLAKLVGTDGDKTSNLDQLTGINQATCPES